MTMYEVRGFPLRNISFLIAIVHALKVLTGKVPLNHISPLHYFAEVVHGKTRPVRPKDSRCNISDDLWSLAEACWSKEASRRPIADQVCDTMERLLEASRALPADPSLTATSIDDASSSRLSPHTAPSPQSRQVLC
jgi:hypothetical protein